MAINPLEQPDDGLLERKIRMTSVFQNATAIERALREQYPGEVFVRFIARDSSAGTVLVKTRPVNPLANLGRCAQCGLTGDAALFETFSSFGGVACKATAACQVRQAGDSAAHFLSTLLRAVRGELGQATTAELAALAVDLDGYRGDVLGWLNSSAGGGAALAAEEADRAARKTRKAK